MKLRGHKAIFIVFIILASAYFLVDQDEQLVTTRAATTLYAGPNSTYPLIQDAINASAPGDTVFIEKGTYYEQLNITQSIFLVGQDRESTIITKIEGLRGNMINVLVDDVVISGLTLMGENYYYGEAGIWIDGVSNCTVTNIIFNKTQTGIYINNSNNILITKNRYEDYHRIAIHLRDSNQNKIINNQMSGNLQNGIVLGRSNRNIFQDNSISLPSNSGISLWESNENTFDNNYIQDEGTNIDMSDSKSNIFKNNTLEGGGFQISGDEIDDWVTHDVDTSNALNDRPIHYIVNQSNGYVPMAAGQIILVNCQNFSVTDQEITNCTYGLIVAFSTNISILNNSFTYCHLYGIYILNSDKCKLINNSWQECVYGMIMISSNDNLIKDNNGTMVYYQSIYIYNSSGNILLNNTISIFQYYYGYSKSGINLAESGNHTFANNTMFDCGIYFEGDLVHLNTHHIEPTNTVNGKPVYYYKNQTNLSVPHDAGQVIIINCSDMVVQDLDIRNTSIGILIGYSHNNSISNNTVVNSSRGISCYKSNNNSIYNNNCSFNYFGVRMYYSTNTTVNSNTCDGNQGSSIVMMQSTHLFISNNSCIDNYEGIEAWVLSNTTIINNHCLDNNYAIRLYNVDDTDVLENWCNDGNHRGILVSGVNVLVKNNNCSNANGYGISVSGDYIIVTNNICINDSYGLEMNYAENCTVENNTIYNSKYKGISVFNSHWNVIYSNDIYLNDNEGIYLNSSSNNTIVLNNILYNREFGVMVCRDASYNTFYHNTFFKNSIQAEDEGGLNTWHLNYPTGGNYWGDYSGLDNFSGANQDLPGSDGIGDTPYDKIQCPLGVNDSYPLMTQLTENISIPVPMDPEKLVGLRWSNFIRLTWDEPTDEGDSPITGYTIYRRREEGDYEEIAQVDNNSVYNDTDIRSRRTYYYKISAENEHGEGPYSNEVKVQPPPQPEPEPHVSPEPEPIDFCCLRLLILIIIIILVVALIIRFWLLKKKAKNPILPPVPPPPLGIPMVKQDGKVEDKEK